MNTQHTVENSLREGPATVAEIVDRTRLTEPVVRHALWYLVYAQRRVTCNSGRVYSLGEPPASWPRMTVIHQ